MSLVMISKSSNCGGVQHQQKQQHTKLVLSSKEAAQVLPTPGATVIKLKQETLNNAKIITQWKAVQSTTGYVFAPAGLVLVTTKTLLMGHAAIKICGED